MKKENNKTILLVEDEAVTSLVESQMLTKHGYKVIIVRTGEEAVAAVLGKQKFDIILMDIDLGSGMDGTQAAEIILKEINIPILFLSSHTEHEIVDKTEKITSYGYVVKNTGETVLLASIRMAFRLHKANQTIQIKSEELEITNDELSKSEERYRTLFENATEGLFMTTPAGRYINVNPSVAKMFRYSSPQDMIDSVTDIGQQIYAHPEDRLTLHHTMQEHGKAEGLEIEMVRKDKSKIWINMNIHTVCDKEGNILYYDGTCVDITERKRAEKLLRESEERYRTLFENATEGLFLTTPAGRYINVNPSVARMFRYSSPQDMIDSVTDIGQQIYAHPEDRLALHRIMQEHGKAEGLELEMVRKDKTRVWISMNIHAVYDTHGNILHYDGACVDITKRKEAEKTLKESEEKYRALINNMQDIVYRSDLNGTILFTTPSAAKILGMPSAESMIGMNIGRDFYYHPEERNSFLKIMKERGTVSHFEATLKRMDTGEPVVISSSSHFFHDKNGNIIGIEGVFSDITERKRAEEALKQSEELFATAFNASPESITLSLLKDSTYLEVNEAFIQKTGYQRKDAVGKTVFELGIWVNQQDRIHYTKELTLKGKVKNLETRFRTRSGEIRDSIISGELIEFKGRQCIISYIIDITDSKYAEEALRKSEELYRTIFENTATANIIVDVDTTILIANSNFAKLTGYSRKELEGKISWTFFAQKEELGKMKNYHYQRRNDSASAPRSYEFKARMKSGKIRDLYMTVAMIPGTTNSVASIIDITDRKRTEEALRQNEERFRDLAQLLPETVFEADLDGRLTFINQISLKKFGYTQDEIDKGINFLDIITPKDRKRARDNISKIKKGEQLNLNEYTVQKKDGNVFTALPRATAIMQNGRPVGFRGFLIDITEHKNMETALKNALDEKQSLLRELQHRIKNNLAMITELIELEKENSEVAETLAVLDNLKWRTRSLASLYEVLFQTESVSEVELNKYLHSIASSLTGTYISSRGKVRIEEHYDKLKVSTKNAAAWGLIFNELITNALKYALTRNRQVIIEVSLKKTRNKTELNVSDNGPGPPGDFDIERSAGFGLMLVKILANQLGGNFSFKRGKINSFAVKVPAKLNDL